MHYNKTWRKGEKKVKLKWYEIEILEKLKQQQLPHRTTISQLTNLCKTLAAAILLTSSTHFGARLGAFFY